VNASDTRSKADSKAGTGMGGKLANVVREMVTCTALSAVGGPKRRQVLVMDEVDGMSGGVVGLFRGQGEELVSRRSQPLLLMGMPLALGSR